MKPNVQDNIRLCKARHKHIINKKNKDLFRFIYYLASIFFLLSLGR